MHAYAYGLAEQCHNYTCDFILNHVCLRLVPNEVAILTLLLLYRISVAN